MNNDLKNTLEEVYNFAEYLSMEVEDLPIILGEKKEVLLGVLTGKVVPTHAVTVAISVLYDVLVEEIANSVMREYQELYREDL